MSLHIHPDKDELVDDFLRFLAARGGVRAVANSYARDPSSLDVIIKEEWGKQLASLTAFEKAVFDTDLRDRLVGQRTRTHTHTHNKLALLPDPMQYSSSLLIFVSARVC